MRIGYSHAEEYDRESDYWQDIEDAQNAQIRAQKNSSKGATNGERKKYMTLVVYHRRNCNGKV
ncbi:hypothetical protein LFU01_27720 [Lysinibacillus fusiformis]|nr:hypothetical protein LSP_20105 [Lysinibacillus sphaericus]RDV35545.1 hypothetical protein C7B90_03010 [Lysinibacillus fusiformis]GED64320.1 hypothetical protein LFU01_27720 [Lysinibacillus fusiformis]